MRISEEKVIGGDGEGHEYANCNNERESFYVHVRRSIL